MENMIDFNDEDFIYMLSCCKSLLESIHDINTEQSALTAATLVNRYVEKYGYSESDAKSEIFEVLKKLYLG